MARLLPSGRMIVVLDVIAILWISAWIVVGVLVYDEVQGLQALSDTIIRTGQGVETVGNALREADIPLVGGPIERAGEGVTGVGVETQRSGIQARESAGNLSTLLGLSVALIPSSSLILFYFPARIAHARERRALRTLTEQAHDDPELRHFLARRALMGVSYRRLVAMDGRPWTGRADEEDLAAAEREEIGVGDESQG